MGMRLSLTSLFRRGDWRDGVSAYLDDELSPRERQRMEARLAASAEMREYRADLEQMRSLLRSFDPAPSSVPFQLTPEMINDPARVPLRPTVAARALRLSMSTAAVGVATFAAVMVFDAVDSPTVTFTTTSAGDMSRRIPTAAVVTDEVEVEVEAQEAAEKEPARVTAVAATSEASERQQPARAEAEQQQEAEQAEAAMQEEEQASVADAEYEQAEQEAAQEEEYEEEAQQQQAEAEQSSKDAASDPSRRALTAGRAGEESDAENVTAEQVVAQQEAEDAAQASGQDDASEPAEHNTSSSEESAASDSTAAESPSPDRDDDRQSASAATQSETRTVATSVTHTESDWPLEQRPRSGTVQLATDPSWELPVQIVLAAIAISATVFWLVLTIVDRRRRA